MLALRPMKRYTTLILLTLLIFAACVPDTQPEALRVIVIADGRQRAFSYDRAVSVGQFLEQIDLTLGELDRVNPPRVTQIVDGMTITVRRVEEETSCEQNSIPYQQEAIPNEGLAPGEERLAQPGVNGIEETCYRTTIEDGEPLQRVQIRQVVVQDPQNEIIFVGVDAVNLEAVPVTGTLAYISNGNAWIMQGSSTTKRPVTSEGTLDNRVFALSPTGNQLLYTQQYAEEESDIYFNTLWAIMDLRANEPTPLPVTVLSNILYADWVPNQPYTISYSTGEATASSPGWQALNDLWLMRLSETNASTINIENLIAVSSGSVYGWWGTHYQWSTDGSALAWARADGVGLVDLETGDLQQLLSFPVYQTFQDWVWQPSFSWSPDNTMLVTTVHGPPFGSEQPETSPIFNIVVKAIDQGYEIELAERVGIWAEPQFSPFDTSSGEFSQGHLAYLQARDPLNSVNGQYDLIVTDRDGSNPRVIFPQSNQSGISSPEITWGPDGRQIALIYQGNLWIVDVDSGRAQQLTVDGSASSPQWGP